MKSSKEEARIVASTSAESWGQRAGTRGAPPQLAQGWTSEPGYVALGKPAPPLCALAVGRECQPPQWAVG